MKYIKKFNKLNQSVALSIKISDICEEYSIINYTINKDGSIDVDDNVFMRMKHLTKLPLVFNKVSGYFDCSMNELTTLEGAPKEVGAYFDCSSNSLTNLKGISTSIDGMLYADYNRITTLEYMPNIIGDDVEFKSNPIDYIYTNYIKSIDNIELFNDYRIIEGNNLYLNRFNNYAKINGYREPDKLYLKDYILK